MKTVDVTIRKLERSDMSKKTENVNTSTEYVEGAYIPGIGI